MLFFITEAADFFVVSRQKRRTEQEEFMKKRSIITVIMMAALLAGCGDSGSAAGNGKSINVQEEEPVTETDADTNETIDGQPMPDEDHEEYDHGFEGVELSVSWDEEGVTFFEDSGVYDAGENPMCAPVLVIEGADVQRESVVNGTQHNERILITDRDVHVSVIMEPCAPSNNCPLNTVTVTVTDSDKGIIGSYTGEELIKRGDTGIWYLDVYEQ